MSEQRAIKFRAWHKRIKEMFTVAHLHFGIEGLAKVETGSISDENWKIEDIELMQFTGLLDRKGREIYEGDILSCSYDKPIRLLDEHVWPHEEFIVTPEERKCEVYWSDGSFKLFDHGKHDWMLLEVANVKEMAILGNIYENADLVPQEKIRRHLKMIY